MFKVKLSSISMLLALVVFSIDTTAAQTDEGVALYEKGQYAAAIDKLKDSDDAGSLYYLGLSLEKIGETKEATKAFERSFKAGYRSFEQSFLELSKPESKLTFSELLLDLTPTLKNSIASLQRAIDAKANMFDESEWRIKANSLIALNRIAVSGERLYERDDVDTPLRMSSKPAPGYTDAARQNGLKGTVKLLVHFGSDGTIRSVIPTQLLEPGLTEQAMIAAQKITFEPALKNGKPVSVIIRIEYTFSIF